MYIFCCLLGDIRHSHSVHSTGCCVLLPLVSSWSPSVGRRKRPGTSQPTPDPGICWVSLPSLPQKGDVPSNKGAMEEALFKYSLGRGLQVPQAPLYR